MNLISLIISVFLFIAGYMMYSHSNQVDKIINQYCPKVISEVKDMGNIMAYTKYGGIAFMVIGVIGFFGGVF